MDYFITELFIYGVCGTEGYVQIGMSEQISYFVYKWTVISECDPLHIIHKLKNKLITKTQHTFTTQAHHKKKWITITYYSPLIHKITIYSDIPT